MLSHNLALVGAAILYGAMMLYAGGLAMERKHVKPLTVGLAVVGIVVIALAISIDSQTDFITTCLQQGGQVVGELCLKVENGIIKEVFP